MGVCGQGTGQTVVELGQEERTEAGAEGCCRGACAVCGGGVGFEDRTGDVVGAEIVSFGRN